MKLATTAKILATGLVVLLMAFEVSANEPIFVKWLVIDDPGDETIRQYWERAEMGDLNPEELVDLGTMLFYRGWPNDALGYFKQALDQNPELSEAWFRIGLVNHHGGDLSEARSGYKKCLKLQSGHAWANFYLGLLEEHSGDGKSAMQHYEMAFKHAPELANPEINPEILSSRLQLGAQVRHFDSQRFETTMPMPFLEPATVRKVHREFEPVPTLIPTPEVVIPQPTPTPVQRGGAASGGGSKTAKSRNPARSSAAGGAAVGTAAGSGQSSGVPGESSGEGSTPFGVPGTVSRGATGSGDGSTAPRIGDTSPEASLRPLWPGLYEIISAFI
jgi:Tetratricopeptide repeat